MLKSFFQIVHFQNLQGKSYHLETFETYSKGHNSSKYVFTGFIIISVVSLAFITKMNIKYKQYNNQTYLPLLSEVLGQTFWDVLVPSQHSYHLLQSARYM